MSVQEAMLALTAHQRAIEQLAKAWPEGSESPINSFRETVRNVLSDMGWDKGKGKNGVTDRQFSNWLKMIAPTIPPRKKTLWSDCLPRNPVSRLLDARRRRASVLLERTKKTIRSLT